MLPAEGNSSATHNFHGLVRRLLLPLGSRVIEWFYALMNGVQGRGSDFPPGENPHTRPVHSPHA